MSILNTKNSNPCPKCNFRNPISSEFCGYCGFRLPKTQVEWINAASAHVKYLIEEKYKNYQQLNLVKNEVESLKAIQQNLKDEINKVNEYVDSRFRQIEPVETEQVLKDLGFDRPRYDFEDSNRFRLKLEFIREQQKELIRNKKGAVCDADWTVNGSRVAGRKQVNDTLKLMLFAFKGEADVLIAKVKYNNIVDTQKRILSIYNLINKLTTSQQCYITKEYLDLKLEELYLSHEYQEKIQQEKEEQRRIREQIREEEVAQREFEKARITAEKEENQFNKALEKAKDELQTAQGENLARLQRQIEILEGKLLEAQTNKERAIARSQMTRSGVVYIISNIGSFGEGVYKIGMTRRLEPMDRIIELGDASVPFRFDVHAMIYCDDAPTLENQLHQRFQHKRVNQINFRKEFFNITLPEIVEAVAELHGEIEFCNNADAVEYRKTINLIQGDTDKS